MNSDELGVWLSVVGPIARLGSPLCQEDPIVADLEEEMKGAMESGNPRRILGVLEAAEAVMTVRLVARLTRRWN